MKGYAIRQTCYIKQCNSIIGLCYVTVRYVMLDSVTLCYATLCIGYTPCLRKNCPNCVRI